MKRLILSTLLAFDMINGALPIFKSAHYKQVELIECSDKDTYKSNMYHITCNIENQGKLQAIYTASLTITREITGKQTIVRSIFHTYKEVYPNNSKFPHIELLTQNERNLPGIYKAKRVLYKYWLKNDRAISEKRALEIKMLLKKLKILSQAPLKIKKRAKNNFLDIKIKTNLNF